MLMLLVSGQRGQTLHVLDIRNMILSDSSVSFSIGDFLKNFGQVTTSHNRYSKPIQLIKDFVLLPLLDTIWTERKI